MENAGVRAHRTGRLAEDGMELQEGQAGCGAAGQGSSPARGAAEQSDDNRSVREWMVGAFQRGQLGQPERFIRQTSQRAGLTVPLDRC